MTEPSHFVEHAFFDGYFSNSQIKVEEDGFGLREPWVDGDFGAGWRTDQGLQGVIGPVADFNSCDNTLDPYLMDIESYAPSEVDLWCNDVVPANPTYALSIEDRRVSSAESMSEDGWLAVDTLTSPLTWPGSCAAEINNCNGRNRSKPSWPCAHCNQTFPTSQDLELHARGVQHKAYICEECGKGFSRRDTHVRHVASHNTSAKLHGCEICEKQNIETWFKRKDHLEQHKRNKHQPIIRSTLDNIRRDRYGSGDDIADSRSGTDSYMSSCPDLETDPEPLRESERQDIYAVLNQIMSRANSGMDFNTAIPRCDSPLENVRLLRGIALLALCPPDQLPLEARRGLKGLLHKLQGTDFRP